MNTPTQQVAFALENYPDRVQVEPVETLLIDAARQNAKRPAFLKLAVPDDLIKQLRGRQGEHDLIALVRVPKDLLERAASPIVLPNEVR